MVKNSNLHKAKNIKNDEFYTLLPDIENELIYYKHHFKDKIVFCNCDDPTYSNFWRYFHINFKTLGLKKLIATHYDKEKPTYKIEYYGGNDNDIEDGIKTSLEGNGDFRNQECLEILDECDIIVTNPPFSLAREFITTLITHNKKFILVGIIHWIPYKEIFPYFCDDKIWIGYTKPKKFLQPNGNLKQFGNTLWYTNLDINKHYKDIILSRNYNKTEYPKYENYDAINIDKISEIPCDYDGVMGVPITFFEKYNPNQFKIIKIIDDGLINNKLKYRRVLIQKKK